MKNLKSGIATAIRKHGDMPVYLYLPLFGNETRADLYDESAQHFLACLDDSYFVHTGDDHFNPILEWRLIMDAQAEEAGRTVNISAIVILLPFALKTNSARG